MIAAAALATLLAAGAAVAQEPEPTPENAQRFLKAAFENIRNPVYDKNGSLVPNVEWVIRVGIGECQTGLNYSNSTGGNENYSLDWKRVSKIQPEGASVRIFWAQHPNGLVFHVGSEELTARVAYAMEVLRAACDPTRGFGF